MEEEDLDVVIKAVVVGNGSVGKSSMIQRYCNGVFTSDYKKTIGVDFLEKRLDINDDQIALMLWDTAGQEEFDAITRAYYRGSQVCVLTFSTVDRASFDAIESWKNKVEAECEPLVMILVQNKIDLLEKAQMSVEEVEALAKKLKLRLYRTSVKMNFNIDAIFQYSVNKYLEQKKKEILITQNGTQGNHAPSSLGIFFGEKPPPQQSSQSQNPQHKDTFKINPNKPRERRKFFCSSI